MNSRGLIGALGLMPLVSAWASLLPSQRMYAQAAPAACPASFTTQPSAALRARA